MVVPEKTYSSNPFVDNITYYAKLMAMNCTVKDEEEALANETKESLYAGDVYIACVEKRAKYEMFDRVPKEILEKYIAPTSNLDIYAKDPKNLKVHLNHFPTFTRNKMLDRLSSLARTVYIDHFDVMSDYINSVGPTWLIDNTALYNKCKAGLATYEDLFDALPIQTVMRIIKTYLNSHGYCDLVSIWDPEQITAEVLSSLAVEEAMAKGETINPNATVVIDNNYLLDNSSYESGLSDYMNQFKIYVRSRSDSAIINELNKISKAMREVFIDHYEIMKERKYFSKDFYFKNATEYPEAYTHVNMTDEEFNNLFTNGEIYHDVGMEDGAYVYAPNNSDVEVDLELVDAAWMGFFYDKKTYESCIDGSATYYELYNLFPVGERFRLLHDVLGEDVLEYNLNNNDVEALRIYFEKYCEYNSTAKIINLNNSMREVYINNYHVYFNRDIYFKCKQGKLNFYDLYPYLPYETRKSIINTEIDETTNIQVYSTNKNMLNSYLNTLSRDTAQNIRDNITKDMISWYPDNHVETNNYYRALIGLPPIDSKGNVYEDTLVHSWDDVTKSFKEFGKTYISQVPTTIYPEYHWKNPIYTFDSYDVATLNEYGVLDDWVSYGCGSSKYSTRYKYLRYLGDEKLDLYTCRKAQNFALIGMPSVDSTDMHKKFIDAFGVNREFIIRSVYSDAYRFNSDYYNKFIIIFILVNTIMDLLTGIPDLIINRDVFDARCIKYLFESYGVPYYSEIPIKYQQAMLKNLNTLLKYKSSTKNMVDICSLFGFSDVRVFGYYLMKDRAVDNYTGEYVLDEDNDIHYDLEKLYVRNDAGDIRDASGRYFSKLLEYHSYDPDYYLKTINVMNDDATVTTKQMINNDLIDTLYIYDDALEEMVPLKATDYFSKIKANSTPASLKFVQVPINENLTEYKNDSDYILPYDDIAWEMTWDGGLDHDYLYNKLLEYEFNAVKSKYISIETVTDLTEMAFQTSYFYNMLFDNIYSEDLLTINIPTMSQNHKFRLADVIFYLFALTYYYYGLKDTIMYSPSQALYVKGYNFSEALNELINDERHFTQYDSYGNKISFENGNADEAINIFDINERIRENNYDYLEEFNKPKYYVKGFNLSANIDELEKWVNDNFQMSLEDFIVSSDTDEYGQVVTLKQFYSLNNSYYQKNIFNGNMTPNQYNNIIKYTYDYDLLKKVYINDLNDIMHTYVVEYIYHATDLRAYNFLLDIVAVVSKSKSLYTYDELLDRVKSSKSFEDLSNYAYILYNIFGVENEEDLKEILKMIEEPYYNEIINNTSNTIYVLDNDTYAYKNNENPIAVYKKYTRDGNGDFILQGNEYYIPDGNETYKLLIDGNVYVRDANGMYVFAAPKVFTIKNGVYEEISEDSQFIITDPVDGNEGVGQYILLKDIDNYTSVITDSDCYIRHSDGHFIRFDYTDYYIRTHVDDQYSNEMIYHDEELFIKNKDNEPTEYYDPSLPEQDRIYYRKLSDYYSANDYASYKDTLYVKDSYGNYIPEDQIISPTNCWYYDYDARDYLLVINNLYAYASYDENKIPKNVLYILVLQNNFDYYKYALDGNGNYKLVEIPNKRYLLNSDLSYITVFDNTKTYKDTKRLIVTLNKAYKEDVIVYFSEDNSFNPSLHDNIWDENDWYYGQEGWDNDNVTHMNGENIWYYKKPGRQYSENNENINTNQMGSGFYIEADEYIHAIQLIPGEQYYLSMDLECNFNGTIQVYCQADGTVETNNIRSYDVKANEPIHINQIFTANTNTFPSIMIVKYNFSTNPINVGDYCIISNLEFSKAYSDHFVANDIPTYDQLLLLYKTNEAIYKYLITQMQITSDKHMYDLYKKLYDSLMITRYNKEIFKTGDKTYAKTYTEFLQHRDELLYDKLKYYITLDEEVLRKEIVNEIIDIVNALDEVLNKDGNLNFIYSKFPAVSITFIQNYIYKLINWFKSWKVHLLGINTLYRMGNGVIVDGNGNIIAEYTGDEYNVKILHDPDLKIKLGQDQKEGFVYNDIKINPYGATNPAGIPYENIFDIDEYPYSLKHDVGLKHRIRVMVRKGPSITFEDDEQNMVLHLNDDTTKVQVENGHNILIHNINDDEFYTVNDNEMLVVTNEDPQDIVASQMIDEINLLSGDYIEYDDLEDDDYE